jgi:hypothetical protein
MPLRLLAARRHPFGSAFRAFTKGNIMKRLLAFTAVVTFLICAGCGDSHESLAADGVSTMKEMVAVLDTVKDSDSAKAAKPKLKSLSEKLNNINERQAKLPAPTEADIKAIESKHGKEMEELQQKMTSAMLRIAFDPKIQAELADIDMKKPGR